MADWPTIASLATAGGTLVLAVATFASVRSANRAARVAETALLAGIRPLLLNDRPEDPPQNVMWIDGRPAGIGGGRALVDVDGDNVYLAVGIRNGGAGLAVLHGWHPAPGQRRAEQGHADPSDFRRQMIDIYVSSGERGLWQGALRDGDDSRQSIVDAIKARDTVTVDLLYGDQEGGQRTITRFILRYMDDDWVARAIRHWNLDRADPR
jgi:hypothetical protein